MSSVRHQAGCVPIRRGPDGLQVLLVTSRYSGQWIVPKGTIEPGEDPLQTALRETEEEAGVRGRPGRRLGAFDYPRGHQTGRVEAFLLEVTEELQRWSEQSQRRRRWFSLEQALQVVERPEVLLMLQRIADPAQSRLAGPAGPAGGAEKPEK